MFREHKYRTFVIVGVATLSLVLIGLVIFLFLRDVNTKNKIVTPLNLATESIKSIENIESIQEYKKNGDYLKNVLSTDLYNRLYGQDYIKQIEYLKSEVGYTANFTPEKVELIERGNNYNIYRISGLLSEKYAKTNESHQFPESFIMKVELRNNNYVITDYYQEDDVPDM